MSEPVRTAIVGCGVMTRIHLRSMLQQSDTTRIAVVCEPSAAAYEATAALFRESGLEPPPNEPDLERLLAGHGNRLDVVLISTPHIYHLAHTTACLEAGLDVLLEKPMVMNSAEAKKLIDVRDRTGRLLVVAFTGSLSPQIRAAAQMLRSGELGRLLNISASVWGGWGIQHFGTWRQQPEMSGGGFMFDTGAHLLNTVADLAGEDFLEVAAWLENNGRPVEVLGVAMARLKSGVLVTMNGCGETPRPYASDVRVFCTKGIMHTDVWGKWLKVQRQGRKHLRAVKVPPSMGAWQQFLAVREGRMPNPCPPEAGLRMAHLYDAIKESARLNGTPVRCSE